MRTLRSGPRAPRTRRLASGCGVELRHDVVQDVLDGALGVAELQRDLARRMARRDQRQHLLLAVGQLAATGRARPPRRCSAVRRAGARAGPGVTTPVPLTAARTAEASVSGVSSSLRRIADCAGLQRADDRFLAAVGGADDARARRSPPCTAATKSLPPGQRTGRGARCRPRTAPGAPMRHARFARLRPPRPRREGPGTPPAPAGRSCGCRGRRAFTLDWVVAGSVRIPGDTTRPAMREHITGQRQQRDRRDA